MSFFVPFWFCCKVPEENVATLQQEAVVSDGQHVLLNGDTENYTGEQGYAVHTISKDSCSKGITVHLNQPYILNCIKMLLWDKDNRSYSYYIQVNHSGFFMCLYMHVACVNV